MLDLQRPHGNTPARDLRAYVQALEAWIITALASFGLRGEVREGRVGVWVTNPQTGIEEKNCGHRCTRLPLGKLAWRSH